MVSDRPWRTWIHYGVAWPVEAASRTEQGEKTVVLSTMLDGLVQRACVLRACVHCMKDCSAGRNTEQGSKVHRLTGRNEHMEGPTLVQFVDGRKCALQSELEVMTRSPPAFKAQLGGIYT